jgi:uncharacterized protein (TIGR02246 family)
MRSVQSDDAAKVRDALAIRALSERYAQAVDAGDISAFLSVFTPDGHLVSNYRGGATHYRGWEELVEVPVRAKAMAPTTMHFIGNHLAEINGEVATGVTYCVANHLRDDRSNVVLMVRYFDAYRRDAAGEWLIVIDASTSNGPRLVRRTLLSSSARGSRPRACQARRGVVDAARLNGHYALT